MSARDLRVVARDLDVIGARIAAYLQLARQFAGAGHLTATRQQLDDVAGLLPDLEALCGAVHAAVNPAGYDDDQAAILELEPPARSRTRKAARR